MAFEIIKLTYLLNPYSLNCHGGAMVVFPSALQNSVVFTSTQNWVYGCCVAVTCQSMVDWSDYMSGMKLQLMWSLITLVTYVLRSLRGSTVCMYQWTVLTAGWNGCQCGMEVCSSMALRSLLLIVMTHISQWSLTYLNADTFLCDDCWCQWLFSTCVWPRVGPGHPSFPLVRLLPHFSPFLLFPFFHWLSLFSSFVHLFPFYQNSPTPFPGRRS